MRELFLSCSVHSAARIVFLAWLWFVASVQAQPPYPPSPVIREIVWAPADAVVRGAAGSDNWPVTWADDDAIYTTWGDGRGFEPFVPQKLSMGFARVDGPAGSFSGVNIRSAAEQLGDGRRGRKGWGLLCVDGVLYLAMGHADGKGGQSQLAWSRDHASTWEFADWVFPQFGLVGFVNYGRNYSGARDEYAYAYSHDGPKADTPADRFILMRAPKDRITERAAWEFFERPEKRAARPSSPASGRANPSDEQRRTCVTAHLVTASPFGFARGMLVEGSARDREVRCLRGQMSRLRFAPLDMTNGASDERRETSDAPQAVWTTDINRRGGVFSHRDACLRSAMTYNAPLRRYLWWQQVPAPQGSADRGDTRFEGGFGIYDAPEPWGPWTTAFYTERWDIGPGEHADFPAKWISQDGRELYLVFSCNDSFSVRRATLVLASQEPKEP